MGDPRVVELAKLATEEIVYGVPVVEGILISLLLGVPMVGALVLRFVVDHLWDVT